MKKHLLKCIPLLLCLGILFSSCGMMAHYRDDLNVAPMMEKALDELSSTVNYTSAAPDHFAHYFAIPDTVKEIDVRYSADAGQIDEVGILHVSDNTAEETAELLESYLSRSFEENHTFYDSYIPQETPKLRDAEVKIFGNYVVYAILDAPARKAVFDSVKAQLQA